MPAADCDLLVIGAGSGGLSVAAGASQMGARVTLLESAEMGGDCLNRGCVPSKALIAASRVAQAMRRSSGFGITGIEPIVDYAAVMDHVSRTIGAIAPADSQERFEALGVRVVRERGRFVSGREVAAGDAVFRPRRIVIATGSSPAVPPIPGLADAPFLTTDTLWSLRERPRHLVILGGGPIGMEIAQAHRRLGSEVTVIEAARALGREDPEMSAVVVNRLREEGVEVLEGAPATRVAALGPDLEVEIEGGRTVSGSHILVALGRKANTDGLDLDAGGIESGPAGIKVDRALRTTNRRVFAIGDAAGLGQFTHLAGYHASVVVRRALLGLPSRAATGHVPRATYTDPEIAQVGLTEEEARAVHGNRLDVARFDIGENDRAVAERRAEGLVKAMVVRGRPVGVSIVGPQAGELIGLWSLVVANRWKMSAVASMVAPYPTLSEANKRAAGAYFAPKLFGNSLLTRIVRLVQVCLP